MKNRKLFLLGLSEATRITVNKERLQIHSGQKYSKIKWHRRKKRERRNLGREKKELNRSASKPKTTDCFEKVSLKEIAWMCFCRLKIERKKPARNKVNSRSLCDWWKQSNNRQKSASRIKRNKNKTKIVWTKKEV